MSSGSLDYHTLTTEGLRTQAAFGAEAAIFSIGLALQKSLALTQDVSSQVAKDIMSGKRESFDQVTKQVPNPAVKLLNKSGARLIYGPASVAIVDREGDIITGDALRGALGQFLTRGTISLNHLDIVVGKLLEGAEVDGVLYKTEVRPIQPSDIAMFPILAKVGATPGTEALFAVAHIYNDTDFSQKAWNAIQRGELNCFSISGQAVQENRKVHCEGFTCKLVNSVEKMDGSAITLCQSGMNQGSVYKVIAKSCGCLQDCWECDV